MFERPENVTVVILSDTEAKELSVRHSLRCILRDCWFLCRALGRHWRRYCRVYAHGWLYKHSWWTRCER